MYLNQLQDRWQKLRERLKDASRLPLILGLAFITCMSVWLLCWTAYRAAIYLFDRYLAEPWRVG